MPEFLLLRPLTDEEIIELRTLAHSQKAEARLRDRARICWWSHEGKRVREIVTLAGVGDATVRHWITRFNTHGRAGLTDAPRIGRPPTYTPEAIGIVVATSLTDPATLELPFGSWTLDRLTAYLHETTDVAMSRSRIGEILQAEGLRWRTQETWFGERPDPAFAEKSNGLDGQGRSAGSCHGVRC
ncbi:MAG: helix-turn-helix domain-containing protein [Thermomicrobiales bacterium]